MKEKTVLLGMSGGVDSSAAAKLLIEDGWKVTGATMKFFGNEDLPGGREGSCCSLEDVEDARSAAYHMGMEHFVFNARAPFAQEVLSRFTNGYFQGITPNPCVECNRRVRFDLLLQRAEAMGIGHIATGHYAGVRRDEETGRWLLVRARDRRKDQTYMLYGLSQSILSRVVFPLSGLEKPEVRAVAERAGLSCSRKRDSQDICFVPDGDYAAFLEYRSGKSLQPGDFVDREGKVIGRHLGQERYTIGQRKGLGVTFGRPVYVVAKSAEDNRVVLGEEAELYSAGLYASDLNWISIDKLESPLEVTVKVRHGSREFPAQIFPEPGGRVRVLFREPQKAVTPGQSAVFYQGELVAGGGVITETIPAR